LEPLFFKDIEKPDFIELFVILQNYKSIFKKAITFFFPIPKIYGLEIPVPQQNAG
jgi:hypothetical protein